MDDNIRNIRWGFTEFNIQWFKMNGVTLQMLLEPHPKEWRRPSVTSSTKIIPGVI